MLLLSINPNPFNSQTYFRMWFTVTSYCLIFFVLYILMMKYRFFFTWHCRSIFTIHSPISFYVSCSFQISLQPICSIIIFGVYSFKIGFTNVFVCFRVKSINSLNLVLHLFNFQLNCFLRIPLIILVPRIYAFQPNFTALLKSVLPGTINIVAFFIRWCNRSLSVYLLATGDGLYMFCVAKLFICRSIVYLSSSLWSSDV